jgi:integrase
VTRGGPDAAPLEEAQMTRKLTAASVKTLKCRHPGGTMYGDSTLPGFAAVVYPSGRIHFRARYSTVDGRRRKVDVGRLGTVTVDEAREAARRILSQANLGEDVAAMRETARQKAAGALTFSTWSKTYLSRRVGRRVRLADTVRYVGLAAERWGGRHLDTITRGDVEALYQEIGAEHPTAANRALAAIGAAFQMAVDEGHLPTNPARKLTKFQENPPRARVLTSVEMSRLVTALQDEDEHTRAAFALLIGSGLRLSEALRARWTDLDAEAGTLRLPRPKSGRVEMVPIPQTTLAVLSRLAHDSEFIVAGMNPKKPRFDLKRAWTRVLTKAKEAEALEREEHGEKADAGFLEDVRVHDLRRSFGLAVARQSGLHVASRLLRHRDVRITAAVYSPFDLDTLRDAVEKRDALAFAPEKKPAGHGGKRSTR